MFTIKKLASALMYTFSGVQTFYVDIPSVQFTKQQPATASPLDPTEQTGRVRVALFDFGTVGGAVADTLSAIRMPAGKVRILRLCIKKAAWATSSTLAMGIGAYTSADTKLPVAANPTQLMAATAMNNTNDISTLENVVIHSTTGFTITGIIAGAASGAAATVGWVEYVVD